MTPDEQMVLELDEFDWIIASAAVRTAEIGIEHVGEYDVLKERRDAPLFTDLASRLDELLQVGGLTLRVTDQEFAQLLIAVERTLFRGVQTHSVLVRGSRVYLDTEFSRAQLQDAAQSLFSRLRKIPQRPTVVLDGGVIV